MKKTIHFKLFLLFVLAFFISCSSTENNPFGLDEVNINDLLSVQQVNLVGSEKEATSQKPVEEVGTSDELIIGKYKGIESSIVIKFESIGDQVTGTVESALLIFSQIGSIRGDSTINFPAAAYDVSATWSTENVDPGTILNSIGVDSLGGGTLTAINVGNDTVRISSEIVQRWIDDPGSNNGVLLKAEVADDFFEYYSDETEFGPILNVTYIEEDSTKTANILEPDASSVFLFDPQPDDRLALASGLESELFISFALPEIPEDATVNFASIKFKVDIDNSIFPATETAFTLIRRFANMSSGQFTGDIDSTFIGLTDYTNGPELNVVITTMLQFAAREKKKEFGFHLAPFDPARSIFRTLLYTSEADSANRPSAELFYTLPPTSQSN